MVGFKENYISIKIHFFLLTGEAEYLDGSSKSIASLVDVKFLQVVAQTHTSSLTSSVW